MPGKQHSNFNQYSGYYRYVDDLSGNWFASPEVKTLSPFETALQGTLQPTEIVLADEPVQSPIRDQPKYTRRALANLLRKLADKIDGNIFYYRRLPEPIWNLTLIGEITTVQNINTQSVVNEAAGSDESELKVPLRDWKAWGYYARPKLYRDGGYVENYRELYCSRRSGVSTHSSAPLSYISPRVNVDQVYQNLMDASGMFHPERWIPGLQHPALPPRPKRWKEHTCDVPMPFPWRCQLNPLLQHLTFDKPPLDWDIRHNPASLCYLGRTGDSLIPISAPDGAQPATYPFVTHMYINSLADDPYPEHFWPFYVINEHGVTVGDVLVKIWENFQEHISLAEFESWANLLSRQQTTCFSARMRGSRVEARRNDIIGTQCLFKGLEPHPDRTGWSMFLGIG